MLLLKIAYLLMLLILVSACDKNQNETIINFGLESAPVTLDPRFATDAASTRINRLIYRGLIDFDANLQPKPDLATWKELSPLHYRFTLQAAEFQHGKPLTAADVKATYDYILQPQHASPHREALSVIAEIVTIDDNTVDFILSQSDNLFVGRLGMGILPHDLIANQHKFNVEPVGCGAFSFVQWRHELQLQRRNDQQLVQFIEVKDPTVRVLKLLRQELDIIQGDLSPELITWLEKQANLNIERRQGNNFAYMGFNLRDEITSNLLIRKAIAHAINREEIINYVLGNAARPANSILPQQHWAANTNLIDYAYDPQLATKLLHQAGYTELNLSYKTSTNPLRIRLATVIQHQLKQVGINLHIQTYDWGTFYGDIKSGAFQSYSLMWVEVKMPDIFEYVFHSRSMPPQGANRGYYVNAQVDAWIDQAKSQLNTQTQQIELYQAIQQQIHADLPYVPLWYEDYILVTSDKINGYDLSTGGNYDRLIFATKTQ